MTFAEAAVVALLRWSAWDLGTASVYVDRHIACPGERYDRSAMIAAHRTLPCGSIVTVYGVKSGRSVTVRIVDRGPYVPGRIIDLTPAAAKALGIDGLGTVWIARARTAEGRPLASATFEDLWSLRVRPAR